MYGRPAPISLLARKNRARAQFAITGPSAPLRNLIFGRKRTLRPEERLSPAFGAAHGPGL